jgi:deoxyadenosine/deoxycytidine kinase
MVKIFSIEGNIGSGKSTFVNILKDYYKDNDNILFMQEPVNDWLEFKDKDGETIITKFYSNQNKYAFSFQMMAYISRVSKLKKLVNSVKNNKNAIIICERCVLTDRNVFAKMLYDDNKIEEINYQIYNAWFDEFIEDIPVEGLVYIKADPEVSYNRVKHRNREGEDIPLEYLRNCNKYHNNWLDNEKTTVLTLDANKNFNYDIKDYDGWIKSVKEFIGLIQNLKYNRECSTEYSTEYNYNVYC